MPRPPRIELEGAVNFVTSRGINNQEIFKDKSDFATYLELVKKYKDQHRFKLFAYLLLPEKIMLLIESGAGATISEIMHDLNSLYTKYFNGRYGRKGHLFEARFRSALVEKAVCLPEITRYLHRQAPDFSNYLFSTYSFYVKAISGTGAIEAINAELNLAEEIGEASAIFKSNFGQASYEAYCEQATSDQMKELEKNLRSSKVFGSEAFKVRVEHEIEHRRTHLQEKELEAEEVKAKVKRRTVYLWLIGSLVLLAGSLSMYLYTTKKAVETQYRNLLTLKESNFAERTKFENQSPLGLNDLEGTEWKVELVSPQGSTPDVLHFEGGRFYSDHFAKLGFRDTSYFLIPQGNRKVLWQAAQSSSKGDSLNWQGTWQGDAMKGDLNFVISNQSAQTYSFYSKEWSYATALVAQNS